MKKELVYIPIGRLHPHKDNPRKDLGDLTELADSIKANGILQNLTVVPDDPTALEGDYTVVIGHRRLAAATLAGITEVPCAVVALDQDQQVRTMLMENMQRADLTVYEQAQGFQMMLDMGDTVESVSETTGFSKTTIKRRVKLLELDRKKFLKAEARGATLSDYLELDKIEDIDLKNKVLGHIGTPNFRDELKKAIDAEALKKRMAKWLEGVAAFATKIEKRGLVGDEVVPMDWVRCYNRWTQAEVEVVTPDDCGEVKYYYIFDEKKNEIELYKDHQEKEAPPETEEQRMERERREAIESIGEELRVLTARYYSLRLGFISEFGAAKKNAAAIALFAAGILTYCYAGTPDADILNELLGFSIDDNTECEEVWEMVAATAKKPEYSLLVCAYASADDERNGYWTRHWDCSSRQYINEYAENYLLDKLYDFLISLGYEMSDEEKALRDGTHELFKRAAELSGSDEENEDDADDEADEDDEDADDDE